MKVLGVDPGYGRTGVAVLSGTGRDNVEHLHLIETPAKMPHEQRLKMVHDELTQVAVDFGAEIMAIERLFHGKNAKTVIGVAEARGVALLVAAQQGLPVAEYTPMQVKQTVAGYGSASKEEVAKMLGLTLKIPTDLWIDDVTDALAVAFTGVVCEPVRRKMEGKTP